ncbi:MAG: hypothetical protein ACE5KZ_01105 [Candidatus Scalinduaceae bacterium]
MSILNKAEIVNIKNEDDWMDVLSSCEGHLSIKDYPKISEYLSNNIKTVFIEKDYIDKDFRDTFYNFYSKKFADYPNKAIRLHFFTTLISNDDIYDLDKYQNHYVGFIVIRPTRINTIGRTILDPSKISKAGGYICSTDYKVHILGAELNVNGFPYISQDTDVTVCAHAACWMVFRYFSERYPTYAEILPFKISQLTENLSYGRLVPSKGLYLSQVAEIFSKFGFYPEIYIKAQYQDNFDRLLYYYIESGLPVVAGLSRHNHAITILGHLSNYERSVSNNSVEYVDGLIINDNNHLPYQKLLRSNLKKEGYCSKYHFEDIDSFIVPLYEKIYFSAEYVDAMAEALLDDTHFGINALSQLVKKNNIIKRIFLTSSKSYKIQRRKQNLPFNLSSTYCGMNMPKFIWVCELSTSEFYSKGEIIGEIIFDATANHIDTFCFLVIHYPDFIVFNDRNYLTYNPERFIKGTLKTKDLLSYQLYKNNLKEI